MVCAQISEVIASMSLEDLWTFRPDLVVTGSAAGFAATPKSSSVEGGFGCTVVC